MLRRWPFPDDRTDSDDERLFAHRSVLTRDEKERVAPVAEAVSLIQMSMAGADRPGDTWRLLALQMLEASGLAAVDLRRARTHELRSLLVSAVRQGNIVLLHGEADDSGGGGGVPDPVPPPPDPKPKPKPKPEPAPKTWIEVEVLYDDGKPYKGAVKLKLPDGSTKDGALAADGTLRVEGIVPGSCEISFPELDGGDWQPA